MTRRKRLVLWFGGAAVVVAAAIFFLAPYNVAASMPHYWPLRLFLENYMENAVRIRAIGTEPPRWVDPEDPASVRLGAAHFASGCMPCHGAPGHRRNPIATSMLPEPTPLEETEFTTAEFRWVVRHGLKYTGMPAWVGTGREDEPWAMAGFLDRYAEIGAEEFDVLAFGGPDSGPTGGAASLGVGSSRMAPIQNCARCHGIDGLGRDGTAPKLAGQDRSYLVTQLAAYAEGRRESGFMEPVAAQLSDAQRERLADTFAAMGAARWQGKAATGVPGDADRGRRLAREGIEDRDVPACVACHGGAGQEAQPGMPRLAGQDARWLGVWLHLWREGPWPETAGASRMRAAARGLTDNDIADLAAYYATTAGGDAEAEE